MSLHSLLAVLPLAGALALGCAANKPPPSGFISDYSMLRDDRGAMRYVNPELKKYKSFLIEPSQIQNPRHLKPDEVAEVTQYFGKTPLAY